MIERMLRQGDAVTRLLLAARWTALAVAGLLLETDRFEHLDHGEGVWLLALAQTVVATAYLPFLRPHMRRLLRRVSGRRLVDDLLIAGVVDMSLALAIVFVTDGRESPFYLFAVSTLLTPAAVLGLRGTLIVGTIFVAGYLSVLSTEDGVQQPQEGTPAARFALLLAVPYALGLFAQALAANARRAAAAERRARRALQRNLELQRELEQVTRERERSRIAREIHDGIAQTLYMLVLNIEALAEAPAVEPELKRKLDGLVTLARQALFEVRNYIIDMRPLLSEEEGLTAALQNQAREFSAASGLPVSVEVTGGEGSLPPALSAALYRIAQEGLANVFRHARATAAELRLTFEDDTVTLEVRDNGVGLGDGARGRGLRHIEERAQAFAGRTEVQSAPGGGTVVRAIIPLDGQR
jgi:signal transduction histidine kinase